ncbi:MAG: toprim domain-containing protein [Bacteroidales bacterium]|nr:toprim domain-containing protein [Bacteroidales bacterium]
MRRRLFAQGPWGAFAAAGGWAIIKEDRCYLVEGYTDVLSMHESGVENIVASSGTALTQEQIRLIKRFTQHHHALRRGFLPALKPR